MSRISKMFDSWALFSVILSLEEVGVFEYLRTHINSVQMENIARELSLDENLLKDAVLFVAKTAPEILCVEGESVHAGRVLDMPLFINLTHFSIAYKNELHTLPELMRGERAPTDSSSQYGGFLGRSSRIYSEKFYAHIIKLLNHEKPNTELLIDLGCGSGALLTKVKRETGVAGLYGVECNVKSYEDDEESAVFINNDLHNVTSWAAHIKKSANITSKSYYGNITITLITVLHEFTKTDEGFSDFISKLRTAFPGAELIVAEQLFFSNDDLSYLSDVYRVPVGFYQLIHLITGQGMPKTHQEWERLFKDNDLRMRSATRVDEISVVYELNL